MNFEIVGHEKKDCRNSPSTVLSFIHLIFTVLFVYKHGNSETEVRTPTNVKTPLKAHGNNVTLESM